MRHLLSFAALALLSPAEPAAKSTGGAGVATPATEPATGAASALDVKTADAKDAALNAAPSRVESAAELTGEMEDRGFTAEDADRAMSELVLMDLRARAEGHTLADVLAVAAKNAYGIDIR